MEQNGDGGWPAFWSNGHSSIDATCYRLDAGGLTEDERSRALAFLDGRRALDGTWQESADLGEIAPPWVTPGDADARSYVTWNVACTLIRFGRLDDTPDAPVRGFVQTYWLAAAALLRLGRSEEARPCLDFVEARMSELDEDDLAWLRRALAGLPLEDRWPNIAAALRSAG